MKTGKKIIGLFLIITMVLPILNLSIYANDQLPVKEIKADVSVKKGYHPITNKTILKPQVTVNWTDPDEWAPADEHIKEGPKQYMIEVQNVLDGSETTTLYKDKDIKSIELQNDVSLETGAIYKISVTPEHVHKDGSNITTVRPRGEKKSVTVMTDVNVDIEAHNNALQVVWDDMGDTVEGYKITYAQVNFKEGDSRDIFEQADNKFTIPLLTRDSEGVTVLEGGKLKYEIEKDIVPAKPYALTVEPIVKNGIDIVQNTTPNIFLAHTKIKLAVFEDGDYLRFEWDIGRFKLSDTEYYLQDVKLYEFLSGSVNGQVIADFPGENGSQIKYYKIQKPKEKATYQLIITYKNYDPEEPVTSEKVTYVPSEIQIRPTKTTIPKPLSLQVIEDMQKYLDGKLSYGNTYEELSKYETENNLKTKREVVEGFLKLKYLVENDAYNVEDLNELYEDRRTFSITQDNVINLVWSTFKKTQYLGTEVKEVTDFDVYYDIWVTDDINEIDTQPKIISNLRYDEVIDGANSDAVIRKGQEVVGFKKLLDKYSNTLTNKIEDIVPNKLYYVQIVAKKRYSELELISDREIAAIYIDYKGDVFAPPVMSRPPLKVVESELKSNNATIEWRKSWFEIYPLANYTDVNEIKQWEHRVYVDENGKIYSKDGEDRELFELVDMEEVESLEAYVNEITNIPDYFESNYISREINLGNDTLGITDVKYKFHILDYEVIKRNIPENGTIAEYIETLIQLEEKGLENIPWEDITPESVEEDENILRYKEEPLEPNHAYIFLIRPYRELFNGDIAMAYYPASLYVSTPVDDGELIPKPSVPYLTVKSYISESQVNLYWDYNTGFEYKILFSKTNEIEDAEELEWTFDYELGNPSEIQTIHDYKLKVTELFPDTSYYFWIQSKSKITGEESHWSNGELGRTSDVPYPFPPKGVGKGYEETVRKYNIDYPVGQDYITVQWILDINDIEGDNGDVIKEYSYILEFAANPQFLDSTIVEVRNDNIGSDEKGIKILAKDLVKIENLVANRVYYIRMKTKVIVSSEKESKIIEKESRTYSDIVWIITRWTDEEYDGIKDPDNEKIPDENFTREYHESKKELEYTFLGDNDKDNNVDQRLIAELLEDNSTEYKVDVVKYGTKPVEVRVINIPNNIIKAMDEQQIDLVIDAGDMEMILPYETMKDSMYHNVYGYGEKPKYKITITDWTEDKQKKSKPENTSNPLSKTQDVKINVANDLLSYNIINTEKPITVKIRPYSRYLVYENEADVYQYILNENKWERTNGEMLNSEGLVQFETGIVTAYGIYKTESQIDKTNHWSETNRQSVAKKINVTGIAKYNPENKVTQKEIATILLNLIEGNKDIDVSKKISSTNMKKLLYSGVINDNSIKDTPISRIEATKMIEKSYELISGKPIYYPNNLTNEEQIIIEKAIEVGIIADKSSIRGKEYLKYGELFKMLDIIIQ